MLRVLLVEPLNSTGGIEELLLAGEERMAFRADFHLQIARCGSRFEHIATDAGNNRPLIVGMYAFFHQNTPFLTNS